MAGDRCGKGWKKGRVRPCTRLEETRGSVAGGGLPKRTSKYLCRARETVTGEERGKRPIVNNGNQRETLRPLDNCGRWTQGGGQFGIVPESKRGRNNHIKAKRKWKLKGFGATPQPVNFVYLAARRMEESTRKGKSAKKEQNRWKYHEGL